MNAARGEPVAYFVATDESFIDNIDYHFKDVMSGQFSAEETVRDLLEGWAEWSEEESIESAQTDIEMLDAYDSFVTQAVNHAIATGRNLHMAIHAAKKAVLDARR